MSRLSIVLALLFLFTACSETTKQTPVSNTDELPARQETSEPADEAYALSPYAVFEGMYRDLVPETEGEEAYVQIKVYGDFLLLEHFLCVDGSVYSFWAEEFRPYEDGYREGEWISVYGQSQTFSLMTSDDQYDDLPQNRSIALTEEGIALTYDFEDTEYYVTDTEFSYHSSAEALRQSLGENTGDTLQGKWSWQNEAETIFVSFEDDDTVFYLWKEAGMPVRVYEGVFVCEGTDTVRIMAEKIGDGNYPYVMSWQYKEDRDGMLWLTFDDGRQMLLMPADESVTDSMDRQSALAYVGNAYDMSGPYVDRYETEYVYTYRLPRFLGDDAAVAAVNEQIMARYSPLVEEELRAMAQQEFISYTDVNWESDVFEGIFYLHIYAETFNWQEHSAYYYDLETGSFLTTQQVLERLLIDPDYFLEAVRQGAEETFAAYFSRIPEDEREEYGYYEMLEWTVSDEAVNFDLPIFVNRWGSIAVYARIGSIAGASEFTEVLYPFDGAVG